MSHDHQTARGDFDKRSETQAPDGVVGIRNFDAGVVETLGATIHAVNEGKGPRTVIF